MVEITENMLFDKDSPLTLYYQLSVILAQKISAGEWKPGQMIPSEAELCKMFYVSRITVRKAIENLVQAGKLVKRQGKGTFVTNVSIEHRLSKFYSFSEELRKRGMAERTQMLSFDIINASDEVSGKLSLPSGEQVFRVKRLRMADEMPYTVETSYIPYILCPGLTSEKIISNGLYNSMSDLGVIPERIVEKLKATAVSKADAKYMKLIANSPAMRVERLTYYDIHKIEYCISIMRGDFFTYTIELKS